MLEETTHLIRKYRNGGVLIDTNILLLYLIGSFDQSRLSKFKRTEQFVEEDFDTLQGFLSRFERKVTTPNIVTEVSNLAGQLGNSESDPVKRLFFTFFASSLPEFEEVYVPSGTIAGSLNFVRFGVTDTGIIKVAKGNFLLLTDDFRLSQFAIYDGVDTINFNHIRRGNWK